MPVITIRNSRVPVSLHGPICVDENHRPRYWATVWQSLNSELAESTQRKYLNAIEGLYVSCSEITGKNLDSLLVDYKYHDIEAVLGGYLAKMNNVSSIRGVNKTRSKRMALGFLKEILSLLQSSEEGASKRDRPHKFILRLNRLYKSLAPYQKRQPQMVRALPSVVVQDLYDIIAPGSDRNPFRTESAQWRNFFLVLLLLHQGLRRGEALLLPVDAIKRGNHPETGEKMYWLNVTDELSQEDTRGRVPRLKTRFSKRQIPVSYELGRIYDNYIDNWRGRQSHPFLFASNRNREFSERAFNEIFEVLSGSLSDGARSSLRDHLHDESIRPHDLRHTCAVVRLTQFVDAGHELDLAIEKLRAFFGWSLKSQMPRLYARAYFENRLLTVWDDSFDTHIETLRKIDFGMDGYASAA